MVFVGEVVVIEGPQCNMSGEDELTTREKAIIEEAVSRVLEDVSPAVLRLETLLTQMQRRLADLMQRVKDLEEKST